MPSTVPSAVRPVLVRRIILKPRACSCEAHGRVATTATERRRRGPSFHRASVRLAVDTRAGGGTRGNEAGDAAPEPRRAQMRVGSTPTGQDRTGWSTRAAPGAARLPQGPGPHAVARADAGVVATTRAARTSPVRAYGTGGAYLCCCCELGPRASVTPAYPTWAEARTQTCSAGVVVRWARQHRTLVENPGAGSLQHKVVSQK